MSIQPLPQNVIAQIKSSTTIISLNGVVLELLKNSLDAGCTKVEIILDYSRGGCVVEDDGLGILPSEFGKDGALGKLYHSSKLNSQAPVHGGRGTFLASLSAMALLSITSHHYQHRSHNTLSMHKSEVVCRQVPAPAQQYLSHFEHGTRVTVRNLFGNMPVRVKQRAVVSEKQGGTNKEWDSLKSNVVLLCLAWPSDVAVTLRESTANRKMVIRVPSEIGLGTEIFRICSILSQSAFITPEERASWVSVGASTSNLKVSGTISLDPSPTKHVQFISFDIQPLLALEGQSILHDEINRLFMDSAFGNEEEGGELDEAERSRRAKDARYKGDGYTNKELKGRKKGVDRWPMFYINIHRTNSSAVAKNLNIDDILDEGNSLSSIVELLQAMIVEFLTKHHFYPKAPRGKRPRTTIDVQYGPFTEEGFLQQRDRKTDMFARSPSAKGNPSKFPRVAEKKPAKIQNTDSDLLGANVKFPSFRRLSSTSDSPFDAWSRIKSGTARPTLEVEARGLSPGQDIQRPSTAPPLSLSPMTKLKSPLHTTPLISATGKVVRRPFEDAPTHLIRSKPTPVRPLLAPSSQLTPAMPQYPLALIDLTEDGDDDLVAWVNPITKVKTVVNKRTGHTVPATDSKTIHYLSQSSSNPNLSSRTKLPSNPNKASQPGPWLSSFLSKWDNPIFRPTEQPIPHFSLDGENHHVLHGHRHNCTQLDIDRAFRESSSSINGRISKAALRNAEIIGQVDKKFILAKLSSSDIEGAKEKMLVIIDQHAADERIRIEDLLAELCTPAQPRKDGMPAESGITTMYVKKGIVFEVSDKDFELLSAKKKHFANWGICYDLPSPNPTKTKPKDTARNNQTQRLIVRALPPGIIERCKSDPKLLIELIRTELYSTTHCSLSNSSTDTAPEEGKAWFKRIRTCPQGILDMLNSRACRSAIMFNDVLSKDQCEVLVKRLAKTAFPFQCAHGRPSLLPLLELGSVPTNIGLQQMREGSDGFGKTFRAWKSSLKIQ